MSFGTAYATKKRSKKCMAKGGEVEHHSPAGGSANRAKGSARVRNEEHIAGVHKAKSIYSPGSSAAGYSARADGGVNAKTGKPVGKEAFVAQAKDEHKKVLGEMNAMPKPKLMAEGGEFGDFGVDAPESHEKEKEAPGAAEPEEKGMIGGMLHKEAHGGEIEDYQSDADMLDMVGRIMKKHYSKGGQVANDVGVAEADEAPAEYDDLVLRDDDMEDAEYTGANSGDELGNAAMEDRDADVVAKIMSSRKKKDRMPRPA